MQRRLSLTEGSSDKFWYIDVVDDLVTVRYGRRGTNGTTKTKQYDTAGKALTEAEKQVTAKLKKGYTDEEGASTVALTPVAPTEPKPRAEPAPAPVVEPVVVEPVVVSDAAADDLGLRVTPFELAYDLSREVVVEADEEPFDPTIEAERAARVVIPPEKKDLYLGEAPLVTTEPLFTTLPSAERREWWRNHFEERRAAAKRKDPCIELPQRQRFHHQPGTRQFWFAVRDQVVF